jgi:hypothetical protein
MQIIVTGYVVKAKVDGREKAISPKFTVKQAALDFRELALPSYPDANVCVVERMSKDGFNAEKKR